MKRKWQIVSICSAFLVGIILAANFRFDLDMALCGILIAIAIIGLLRVKSSLGYILLISIGLVLGIWRFELYETTKLPSALQYEGKKVVVTGVVQGEPRWDEYRTYVFYLSQPHVEGQSVNGLVRIKALHGVAREGQQVRASGKLKYGQGKAESFISYANVEVIDSTQPVIVQIKEMFVRGLQTTLPSQSAAFMSGILIGSRSSLTSEYQDVLTLLGLTHIIAVSGYNLTILIGFLHKRFAKNWRWGGLVGSIWIILGFVIISGASASIVRAGIMSTLFLLASYYGRRLNLIVCMALVASTMVILQPESIISDIGWQLSFLSLLGITLFTPKISSLLPSKPRLLNDILSVTLAAQLATLGFVAYKFGSVSLIAPLTNLIVIPLIPVLMLLGFVAALAGVLLPSISHMTIGRPVHILFTYLFDLLAYLSTWRIASLQVASLSLSIIAAYYLTIIFVMSIIRPKSRGNISDNSTYATMTGITNPIKLDSTS